MTDHQERAEAAPADDPRTDHSDLRAADGRVPGRRGLETRRRLLDATEELLTSTGYRDLKVIDIARRAGTSPATFYQYFPDVEAAILFLARETAEEGGSLAAPLTETWTGGKRGYRRALELADRFLDFWDEHEGVLRVVDLAIAEGDARFRELRTRMLNPVTIALRDAVAEQKDDGRHPDTVEPAAQAGVLVSMLSHVAKHHRGLEAWEVDADAARESLGRFLHWGVTGRTPPSD